MSFTKVLKALFANFFSLSSISCSFLNNVLNSTPKFLLVRTKIHKIKFVYKIFPKVKSKKKIKIRTHFNNIKETLDIQSYQI